MALPTGTSDSHGMSPVALDGALDADLDSSHKIIGSLVEELQNSFKKETHYERPLMSSKANILFALDNDSAQSMISFMTAKLKNVGGFAETDFRFTHKPPADGLGLQRLRLEFTQGVTMELIRRVVMTTAELKRPFPAS